MTEARFARLITMKAKAGKGDEFVKKFEEEVASTAAKLAGMRRLYLLRQVGRRDKFAVISLWDDEKSAERYAKSGRNKGYEKKLAGVRAGKEKVKKFHVELHLVGESAKP
ncbi:MAG: antibiotic biosynthesis monooxygenase [Nitrososphaerales archaeon]|nr:antibiotic biosynthesis monooxygenase [Nitrososphaerales archaeon]